MARLSVHILIFFTLIVFSCSTDPRVLTSLGEIIGKTTTLPLEFLAHKDVHQYLGIPFAQPPVGERRFLKPEAEANFTSTFYAQTYGDVCPQISARLNGLVNMSQDCLFLNVFVPSQTADNQSSGHAVMVWIHGGGFLEGAGSEYDGSFIAAAGNVIVVTINYRLGVFGFLSTGDHNAPGNVGLWDQRMALQWVHDHISRFGGDNGRVTIAGESAGAMSVIQYGLTFESSSGLFQRIIAQSGSMSIPTEQLERDVLDDAKSVANSFGCNTDSITKLLHCLRDKSVNDTLTTIKRLGNTVNFGPIIDADLIKINPKHIARMAESESLKEVELFRSMDLLSGFNAYEGVLWLPFVIPPGDAIETIEPTSESMNIHYVPSALNFLYRREFKPEIANLVEAQYTNWKTPNDTNSIRLQITKMLGDASYGAPAIEMARLHKKSSISRNFMYYFTPVPSHHWIPTPSWIPGATHSDELLFVFGGIGYIGVGDQNAWELELITKIMSYWTNFIKSGDPNYPDSVSPYWPEYNMNTGDYLKLEKSMSDSSAGQHFYAEEANFWLELFPDLVTAVQADDSDCDGAVITSSAEHPVCWIQLLITAMLLFKLICPKV